MEELRRYAGRWQDEDTSEIMDIHLDADGLWLRIVDQDGLIDSRIYLTRHGKKIYRNMSMHEWQLLPENSWPCS